MFYFFIIKGSSSYSKHYPMRTSYIEHRTSSIVHCLTFGHFYLK